MRHKTKTKRLGQRTPKHRRWEISPVQRSVLSPISSVKLALKQQSGVFRVTQRNQGTVSYPVFTSCCAHRQQSFRSYEQDSALWGWKFVSDDHFLSFFCQGQRWYNVEKCLEAKAASHFPAVLKVPFKKLSTRPSRVHEPSRVQWFVTSLQN